MTRTIIGIAALSLATLFQATSLDAQDRWGIELRGNGALATQDAARDSHEYGYGLEGNVQYRFLEHVSAYAGWGWSHFDAVDAIAGPGMELEETGYVLGLRFDHPLRQGWSTSGWVRTGATYNHLELENASGDIVDDSGHGLGWEFAAGLSVPLHRGWNMTPGIRYRSLSRDLEVEGMGAPVELQSVAFEVGLVRRF